MSEELAGGKCSNQQVIRSKQLCWTPGVGRWPPKLGATHKARDAEMPGGVPRA